MEYFTSKLMFHIQEFPQTITFWVLSVFVLGCCVGSFLNVCIWRIPRGESLIRPPSHCPKCGHRIRFYENLPLASYLCLGGKCSGCKTEISPRYFIVELMTGLLFGALMIQSIRVGDPLGVLILYFFVSTILICSAFTDCDWRIIPDEFTYLAMIGGPVFAIFLPEFWRAANGTQAFLLSLGSMAAVGALLSGVALLGKGIFGRDAFGWGDVKYLTGIAGCFGAVPTLFILLFACFAALLFGSVFRLLKPKRRKRPIAFGPFISGILVLWMFFGNTLLSASAKLLRTIPSF